MKPSWIPYVLGGTTVLRQGSPTIRGTVRKDSSGDIPGIVIPSDIVIETDVIEGTPVTVTLSSAALTQIIADINSALSASSAGSAYELDGCLHISSASTGLSSWIRVHPATNDYDSDDIPEDAAIVLGIPRHDERGSTAYGTDAIPTKLLPSSEANPQATLLLARGEERASTSINRALEAAFVQSNQAQLVSIADRVVLHRSEIPESFGGIVTDADGYISQIVLTDLSDVDESFTGRFFVGAGSRTSSKQQIAQSWVVCDRAGRSLYAYRDGERVPIRVSAVMWGENTASLPVFADETSAPSPALSNASGITPDGGNLLGVERLKRLGSISAIRQGLIVVDDSLLDGDGFVTAGVVAGDIVTITGAASGGDYDNNGYWLVESVISERELALRPRISDQIRGLSDDTGGSLGNIAVASFMFESVVAIALDPPLPRWPEEGVVLYFGRSASLEDTNNADQNSLFLQAIEPAEAGLRIAEALTLQGTYDGGPRAEIGLTPVTLQQTSTARPQLGSALRSSLGGTLVSPFLIADTDTFTASDVRRSVLLRGTTPDGVVATILEVVDGATVRLLIDPSLTVTGSTVTYSVYAAVSVGAPGTLEIYADGALAAYEPAITLVNEDVSTSATTPTRRRPGFLSLQHVRTNPESGSTVNRNRCAVSAFPGGQSLTLGFDPEESALLVPSTSSETRGRSGKHIATIVRILNGPSAGFYRLKATTRTTTQITLEHLDGSTPSAFSSPGYTVYVAFYQVVGGSGIAHTGNEATRSGLSKAGLYGMQDGVEGDLSLAVGVQASWRGSGYGFYARVNDDGWENISNSDGASGYMASFVGYAPAQGIEVVVEGPSDTAFTEAQRSSRGITLRVAGYAHTPDNSTYGAEQSWGAWVHQDGRDPALFVTRGSDAGRSGPRPLDIETGASPMTWLVDDADPSLPSAALRLCGVLFAQSGHGYGSTDMDGVAGIYSDGAVAAGAFLYSMHRPGVATSTYKGDIGTGTMLGTPGQVLPRAYGDTLSGDFDTADEAIFAFPHDGIVSFTAQTGAFDAAGLGLGLSVVATGGTNAGREWVVIGYTEDSGTTYLALQHHAGTAPAVETTTLVVRGRRFYRSYTDLASWMEVGTEAVDTPSILAGGLTAEEQLARQNEAGLVPEGFTAPVPALAGNAGLGLGSVQLLADMPGVGVAYGSYTDGWSADTAQPRTPFPNEGVLSAGTTSSVSRASGAQGPVLTQTVPGNLLVDEFALEHVTSSVVGATLSWCSRWGGCLVADWTLLPDGGSATVRVWGRGERFRPTLFGAYTLRIIVQTTDTRSFTLALRKSDGTALATVAVPAVGRSTPRELSATLTLSAFTYQPGDAFPASIDTAYGIHPTVDFGLSQAGSAVHILSWQLLPAQAEATVQGALRVQGPLSVAALRSTSPFPGFVTVAPAQVSLLQDTDFARSYGHTLAVPDPTKRSYGTQEGKGVGLLYDGSYWIRPVVDIGSFFQKGGQSAAIVGNNPYFDPLFYVKATESGGAEMPNLYVQPGMTGFTAPLDLPHGAKITSISSILSFVPAQEGVAGSVNSDFQVYASTLPPGSLMAAWEGKSGWDAREGYVLRIRRHNLVGFAVSDDVRYTGTDVATDGWSEVIWEEAIDLSGETEPARDSNPASSDAEAGSGHYFSSEYTSRVIRDLQSDSLSSNTLPDFIVDRTHYAYSVEIAFYIGYRTTDGANYYTHTPLVPSTYTVGGLDVQGVLETYPLDAESVTGVVTMFRPAVIKFRGIRVGYTSDRPGGGGWG